METPHRKRIKRRKFPPNVHARIVIEQDGICACGCQETLGDDPRAYEFDHILPLADGGKDEPENLQALLRRHHTLKSSNEAKSRAKVARIQAKGGLTRRKMNAHDRALARALDRHSTRAK